MLIHNLVHTVTQQSCESVTPWLRLFSVSTVKTQVMFSQGSSSIFILLSSNSNWLQCLLLGNSSTYRQYSSAPGHLEGRMGLGKIAWINVKHLEKGWSFIWSFMWKKNWKNTKDSGSSRHFSSESYPYLGIFPCSHIRDRSDLALNSKWGTPQEELSRILYFQAAHTCSSPFETDLPEDFFFNKKHVYFFPCDL